MHGRWKINHIESPSYRDQQSDREWLASQGFTPTNLPRKATWYKPDGTTSLTFTDLYHRKLYRARGFTLKPSAIITEIPERSHLHPLKPRRMPILTRAVIDAIEGLDKWEGTATELLSLIRPRKHGMPSGAIRLSREIMEPRVRIPLEAYGYKVSRSRNSLKRKLCLYRH